MLLAAYPAQAWLPSQTAWENGWIENTQVAVLGLGLCVALWWGQACGDARVRALCRVAVVLWVILIARELSWGGAFLDPVSFSEEGPFYSSRGLWYKPVVYPLLALLLGYCLWCSIRFRLDQIVRKCLRAVWPEILLIVLGMALSACAEGHGPAILGDWSGTNALVIEEWSELAAYCALLAAQLRVFSMWALRQSAA